MAIFSLKSKEVLSNLTAPANIDLGAMIPIATVTVGSGGSSTITFSDIPQNYEHLQLRFMGRSNRSSTLDVAGLQINSTYYSKTHILNGDGSTVVSNTTTGLDIVAADTANANVFGLVIFDILDYTNINKNRVCRALSGFDNNGGGNAVLASAWWDLTQAATSLTIYPANGTLWKQYSHAALYGIKRAGA